jgi:hypothetical protein
MINKIVNLFVLLYVFVGGAALFQSLVLLLSLFVFP